MQNSPDSSHPEIGKVEVRRKIGEELRSVREFRELTLDQVTKITKISKQSIKHIESGNWSFLPPTYIKAFIQSIAEAVGMESKDFQTRLDELFKHISPTSATPLPLQGAEKEFDYRTEGFVAWLEQHKSILFYSALSIIVIVWGVFYLSGTERSSKHLSVKVLDEKLEISTEPVSESLADTATTEIKPKVVIPVKPSRQTENYELTVYAVDTCYVKISQQDSTLYERTLWPRNLVNKDLDGIIKLSLGNAPGIRLILNGDTLPDFAPGRRVRMVRLNKDGFVP
ncbi:MAG: helix-turn-helix domain-containing protein [Candidatus Hatepunaea meridiana]|nr:helix-turn-helix domain-containing protein [Candidatus Hatepunaea meridiana]